MSKIKFGAIYKDILTGFEGMAIERYKYITGCDTIRLKPEDDTKEAKNFTAEMLKFVDDGASKRLKLQNKGNSMEDIDKAIYDFGDKCEDKITGFKGKVVSMNIAITGDISYCISPKYSKKNTNNDGQWFDEGRLVLKNKSKDKIKTDKERVGGEVPKMKLR